MAEGVTIGHKVAWISAEAAAPTAAKFLPAEATALSSSKKENEGQEMEEEEEGSGELRIAWQYRKYIRQQQQQAGGIKPSASSGASLRGGLQGGGAPAPQSGAIEAGIGRQWCRSYDLTKGIGEDHLSKSGMVRSNCFACKSIQSV